MGKFFLYIIVFSLISCKKNYLSKSIVEYKDNLYEKDAYFVHDLSKKHTYKTYSYVRKINDSLLLYEVSNCNVWLLGILQNKHSSTSLNNGCGNSTQIEYLDSYTNVKYFANSKSTIYLINLIKGTNITGDSVSNVLLLYSNEDGLMDIYKSDSINFLGGN